jgi:hypothetical protein
VYKTIKHVHCRDKKTDVEFFTDEEYEDLGFITHFCELRSWRLSFSEIEYFTGELFGRDGT